MTLTMTASDLMMFRQEEKDRSTNRIALNPLLVAQLAISRINKDFDVVVEHVEGHDFGEIEYAAQRCVEILQEFHVVGLQRYIKNNVSDVRELVDTRLNCCIVKMVLHRYRYNALISMTVTYDSGNSTTIVEVRMNSGTLVTVSCVEQYYTEFDCQIY